MPFTTNVPPAPCSNCPDVCVKLPPSVIVPAVARTSPPPPQVPVSCRLAPFNVSIVPVFCTFCTVRLDVFVSWRIVPWLASVPCPPKLPQPRARVVGLSVSVTPAGVATVPPASASSPPVIVSVFTTFSVLCGSSIIPAARFKFPCRRNELNTWPVIVPSTVRSWSRPLPVATSSTPPTSSTVPLRSVPPLRVMFWCATKESLKLTVQLFSSIGSKATMPRTLIVVLLNRMVWFGKTSKYTTSSGPGTTPVLQLAGLFQFPFGPPAQ